MRRFGGIEAGGTKFVCAVASAPPEIESRIEFPTATPEETFGKAAEFFAEHRLEAIGIGSFGPVDLKRGWITTTPKEGWRQVDFAGSMRRSTGLPVVLDTDVNAAAWGEWKWGAARDLDTFLYLTIGTGVGGGGMCNGELLHGLNHPEMGHLRIPNDDGFAGVCPFHGDCWEGLISGPALAARWGRASSDVADDDPRWRSVARQISLGLNNLICTLSPEKIILGGGVMQRRHLYPLIRAELKELLNGYLKLPALDTFIAGPTLGRDAGVLGAIGMAMDDTKKNAGQ